MRGSDAGKGKVLKMVILVYPPVGNLPITRGAVGYQPSTFSHGANHRGVVVWRREHISNLIAPRHAGAGDSENGAGWRKLAEKERTNRLERRGRGPQINADRRGSEAEARARGIRRSEPPQ